MWHKRCACGNAAHCKRVSMRFSRKQRFIVCAPAHTAARVLLFASTLREQQNSGAPWLQRCCERR